MINKRISESILTISCAYNPPKGGIAQVVYTYSQEVYPIFKSVVNSKSGKLRNLWYAIIGLIKTLWVLLYDKQIKIVHIHTASRNSFYRSMYFVRLAHLFQKKIVLHVHGGGFKEFYKTNKIRIKKDLQKVDVVVALTDSWENFFRNEIGLSNVDVVCNIVSQPQIASLERKDGLLHFLFLGFILEQKGIFDLLEMINEHKNELEGKIILHVGGNHEVERLKSYVSNHKLENIVNYEGWVSGQKKIDLLNLMDAFILPSYIEGFPISILESFSYGKPVFTTPVGGIPEMVNETNGYLFQPGDKIAMFEKINYVINNPETLVEKGQAARRVISNNLPNEVAIKLTTIYNKLLF